MTNTEKMTSNNISCPSALFTAHTVYKTSNFMGRFSSVVAPMWLLPGYVKTPRRRKSVLRLYMKVLVSKPLIRGLMPDVMSLFGPSVVQHVFFFSYGCQCLRCLPRVLILVSLPSLRKHAYSNILKILPPKNENFQIKFLISFIFLLKT